MVMPPWTSRPYLPLLRYAVPRGYLVWYPGELRGCAMGSSAMVAFHECCWFWMRGSKWVRRSTPFLLTSSSANAGSFLKPCSANAVLLTRRSIMIVRCVVFI